MARRLLNAYQDWYIGGVSQFRMNSRPRADGFPRAHVKRCGGWGSIPEADIAAPYTPSGRRGEVPFPATTRGKTLTYELQVQADSEPDLNTISNTMRGAFADVSSLGMIVATPWPGHGTDIWASFARVIAFDGDEEAVYGMDAASFGHYGPWKRDPLLSIRQIDGIWFWANESGTFLTPMQWISNPGTSVTVVNSGNAPVGPVITVYGVTDGQDLHVGRSVGAGTLDLWFRKPVDAAGLTGAHDVVVDFNQQLVTVGTTDVTQTYDASASTWWDEYVPGIPPGSHVVFRGAGAGVGIECHIYSGSW